MLFPEQRKKGRDCAKSLNLCLLYALMGCFLLLPSCIDDDLSKCLPKGYDFDLNYSLRLTTELTVALQEEVDAVTEAALYNDLTGYLQTVFTDKAHDVDLHFYDLQTGVSEHQESHIIDASQASLTIRLPKDEYMHLAVANIATNPTVALVDTTMGYSAQLRSAQAHNTGLFTARLPMEINKQEDQHFDVRLYMANCATIFILDTVGSGVQSVRAELTDMASAFLIEDSTYLWDAPLTIEAQPLPTNAKAMVFTAVSFPSPTEDAWHLNVTATNKAQETAQTTLTIGEPLQAGQLRIIRAALDGTGAVQTTATNVGMTVTFSWADGGQHDIDL